MNKRVVISIAMGLLAACVIGVLIIAIWGRSDSPVSDAVVVPAFPTLSLDETVTPTNEASEDRNHSASPQLSDLTIRSLEALCPDVHDSMSDECLDSLDRYFLNSVIPEYAELTIDVPIRPVRKKHPVDPNIEIVTMVTDGGWSRSLPLADAPTFDFVFGDPNTNKLSVLESLKNEDCTLSKGAIRSELSDTCHADSLVAFAVFLDVCQRYELDQIRELRPQGNTLQNSYDQELYWIENSEFESFEVYQRVREEVLEKSFRDAWVVRKCSSFDDELFSPVGILGPPSAGIQRYKREHFLNATRDDITSAMSNWANRQAIKDLFSIATRLGHPWALAHYHLPFPDEDPDFWKSLRLQNPFVYHLYMYKTKAVEVTTKERLKHAVLAHAHAKSMSLPDMESQWGLHNPQLLNTHLVEVGPYTLEQLEQAYVELDIEITTSNNQ